MSGDINFKPRKKAYSTRYTDSKNITILGFRCGDMTFIEIIEVYI